MSKLPSFTSAMKAYFGLRAGTSVSDFAKELKDLSYAEKCEFHRMLTEDAKIPCEPPMRPSNT
jgi:hypothetical protein